MLDISICLIFKFDSKLSVGISVLFVQLSASDVLLGNCDLLLNLAKCIDV